MLDLLKVLKLNDGNSDVVSDAYRLAELRFTAEKSGITIRKRFNRTFGESGYMLIDTARNFVIAGSEPIPFSFSLDDIEEWFVSVLREPRTME